MDDRIVMPADTCPPMMSDVEREGITHWMIAGMVEKGLLASGMNEQQAAVVSERIYADTMAKTSFDFLCVPCKTAFDAAELEGMCPACQKVVMTENDRLATLHDKLAEILAELQKMLDEGQERFACGPLLAEAELLQRSIADSRLAPFYAARRSAA